MSGDATRRDGGYILFGVLMGASLLGVGLLAAVTLWSRVLQREREAELVFRGEAVVRAIERFQADRPGAFPETLEDLVEGRYLRRAWLDPMTGNPFVLLRAAPAAGPATGPATGPAGAMDEEIPPETERADSDATPGIVGVVSASDELSFRLYNGARRYSEWRFEAQPAAPAGSDREAGPEDAPSPNRSPDPR